MSNFLNIMIIILLFVCVCSQLDDGITVEEGEVMETDTDDISLEVIYMLTDINEDAQPTRIANNDGVKTYYILEAEGISYLVAIDSDILPETVLSDSFLQKT